MNNKVAFRQQAGLSMVEVLVALVIFAFGLLGAAGLQMSSLKANQYSVSSSMAVGLARDYGEVMRMLVTDPASTATLTLNTFLLDTTNARSSPAPAACNGTSASCTNDELAKAAIDDWVDRVRSESDPKATLRGGRAEICHTSNPRDGSGNLQWGNCDGSGDTVVAKMGWYAKKMGGNAEGTGNQAWMTEDRPRMAIATFYLPPEWAKP